MTFGNAVNTESRGKDIKYVIVELIMVENDDTKSISTAERDTPYLGLLRGMYSDLEGNVFISVLKGKDTIQNFNMEFYNVLMLEIFDGVEREMFFCRADEEDQTDVMNIINATLGALKKADRMTANDEIVDVNSYSNLPKAIDQNDSKTQNAYKGIHVRSGAHSNYNDTYTPVKKKEPTAFKRNSEIPDQKMLEKMKEMVLKIADGSYEGDELDFPDGDEDNETKEDDATTQNSTGSSSRETFVDDDFYGYGGTPFC